MEFKRIEIGEEFFVSTYRFEKVNKKQAKMLVNGKIKDFYEEFPVNPADNQVTEKTSAMR